MLNLYQIHLFVTVADAGSYSEAARRLHMTQPAVSMGVAGLEKTLGGEHLFQRRGQRVELTPAGHQLLGPARQLLELATQTEQTLQAGQGVLTGRLALGSATAAGAVALAALLGGFAAAHPRVQAGLALDEPAGLLDQLRAGDLDTILLPERGRGRNLDHALLATDEWLVVVRPDHAWAAGGAPESTPGPPGSLVPGDLPVLAPDVLRGEALVLVSADLRPGLSARRELPALLEERGLAWRELHVALEVPTDPAVLAAVTAGGGVGIVSRSLLGPGPLRPFRLRGGPLPRQHYLIRDRRLAVAPAAVAWWAWVTERVASSE